jgi:hypothetical protein
MIFAFLDLRPKGSPKDKLKSDRKPCDHRAVLKSAARFEGYEKWLAVQ